MALISDFVKSIIPVSWKSSPSGWISGNCPMCIQNGQQRPDTKGRGGFHINDNEVTYHCFNCGYKTGWAPGFRVTNKLKRLLKAFGADETDVNRLTLDLMKEDQLAELLTKRKEITVSRIQVNWKEIQLPPGSQPFYSYDGEVTKEFIAAAEYLTDRGFDVTNNNFWYSPSPVPALMNKRFIIPFFYKGVPVGYAARWIGNPPEGATKYARRNPPHNFVYGLDNQENKQIVIVTEGEIDAIITDGVAIGSNNCNADQAHIINALHKRIILLPDADKAGMKLVEQAIKYGWEVSFPDWTDCKDAGDAQVKYGRMATVRSIIDYAESNPVKIRILAKKYCR